MNQTKKFKHNNQMNLSQTQTLPINSQLSLNEIDSVSILHILNYLSLKDISHLSSTNDYWRRRFQPQLFQKLAIYLPIGFTKALFTNREEVVNMERHYFNELISGLQHKLHLVTEVKVMHQLSTESTLALFPYFQNLRVLKFCYLRTWDKNVMSILKCTERLEELHFVKAAIHTQDETYEPADYFQLPVGIQVIQLDVKVVGKLPPPLEDISDRHQDIRHITLLNAKMSTNFMRPYATLTHVELRADLSFNPSIVRAIVVNNPQLKRIGLPFDYIDPSTVAAILKSMRLTHLDIAIGNMRPIIGDWSLNHNFSITTLGFSGQYHRSLVARIVPKLHALESISFSDIEIDGDKVNPLDWYSPTVKTIAMSGFPWLSLSFGAFDLFDKLETITMTGIYLADHIDHVHQEVEKLTNWERIARGKATVVRRIRGIGQANSY